jgi:hypothetical protein
MISPRLLSVVFASCALVAVAPGCSSSAAASPEVGLTWVVEPGTNVGTCPVPGEDTFTIGGGGLSNAGVTTGSTVNGKPVTVDCKVSGNDSSGFYVFAEATYGTGSLQSSIIIQGKFNGTLGTQTGISGSFLDALSLSSETLAEAPTTGTNADPGCTISYPTGGMGIASGRVWAHIDCPSASDSEVSVKCDAHADFLFENCSQ